MGRKKRKAADDIEPAAVETVQPPKSLDLPPPPPKDNGLLFKEDEPATTAAANSENAPKKASSGYAMTTHSAEIIDEDLYISDGSVDSEDEANDGIEMLLVGSRMGVMRRGLHHPLLVQPNRQWVKKNEQTEGETEEDKEESEQKRLKEQEEELAKLDPAQRAARLLIEKQRKLEEAKENARRLESEENAGRDPCLFSKRTAFDIRFDQIDDKPWTRGAGDFTDFFNYDMTEEDWLEYAQQQLTIRQELTDANRQKRAPDPTLVPVTPRKPSKQQPKVAVAGSGEAKDDEETELSPEDTGDSSSAAVVGPVLVKKEIDKNTEGPNKKEEKTRVEVHVGSGGAWGAGAAPGSVLAKMIEDQEKKEAAALADKSDMMDTDGQSNYDERGDTRGWKNQDTHGDHNNRGRNQESHGGHQDWNNQHRNPNHRQDEWDNHSGGYHHGSYGGQQRYDQRSARGRGYYGGRGGRGGRGGGGGRPHYPEHGGRYSEHGDQRHHHSGGPDHHHRKRPRDDHGKRRHRR